jgi:Lrp/AsnC family transcriptional regulator, leucine-responsive regulatory protein
MPQSLPLDKKDKIIISMYSMNRDISQEEIAREVGLSQPSVAVRIRKLKEGGAIDSLIGINPFKMGMYIAKVDVVSTNPSELLDMIKGCPYFAHGFTVSGRHNLCLIFISEDIARLESMVNCHIRHHDSVSDVDFNIIISSENPFILPIQMVRHSLSEPPCSADATCGQCTYFLQKKCGGCPMLESVELSL